MRKRNNSDEEGSEMDIDEEERKIEMEGGEYRVDDEVDDKDEDEDEDEMEGVEEEENDDDDDDDDEAGANKNTLRINGQVPVENPFLDSFYSLSSQDPNERSQAAQVLLHHCLLGPSANSKDAAYAFRRLLNGLCSGRAAARQGNASALSSFLKIAFRLGKMNDIKSEALANDSAQETSSSSSSTCNSSSSSLLKYVRDRLLSATDPHRTVGKKRGSDERDYHFGRLFGILGIVRSNILRLPCGTDTENTIEFSDYDEIKEVVSDMVCDLAELFWLRKWMREPAAHGITAILNLFFGSNNTKSQLIAQHLIEEVVVPKFLIITHDQKNEESNLQILMQKYCAEQVGIGIFIQSQSQLDDLPLPFPLDQPLVSIQTLPWIGQALSETSVIVQPRTHFVWDTLWCYLTKKADDDNSLKEKTKDPTSLPLYILRKTIPRSEDNVVNIIDDIMRIVVKEKLLGIDEGVSIAKSTHERKSLGLCIVRNLSGAPFVSSISGPIQINMDSQAIENVILTPDIIRSLFIDVICAGNQKQRASHMLKPLAVQVLGSLVESTIESGDASRQLAFVKAFTNCEPRFDSQTKTNTVSDLLSFSNEAVAMRSQFNLWEKYLTHLEARFLQLCNSPEESVSSAEANGYVELLYSAAKNILHTTGEDTPEISLCKDNAVKRILMFFLSTAFFDCSKITKPTKRKKKAKKISAVENAFKIRNGLQEGKIIAYPIRAIVSARFFSLVSLFATTVSREPIDDNNAKVEKDSNMLAILAELCENWKQLESNEAKRFVAEKVDDDDVDTISPELIIMDLQSKVSALKITGDDNKKEQYKKRCCTGIAILALTLYVHRLSCGPSNEIDEDLDVDEEEDEEEIRNALEGLKGIADDFIEGSETDSNPLLGLAEICANILSSPIGSGNIGRGAAPKLVREAVKYAWLGGLRLASAMATDEKTLLDSSVVGILMEGIGASNGKAKLLDDDVDMEGESDEENEEDDESDGGSDDDLIFSKASQVLNNPEDIENEGHETSVEDEDEDGVKIDSCKLQSMLEDDSDVSVDGYVLEHHEGADAALAKLIKLKQGARKAGQQAREKIEVSNQLRCTFLVDLLLGRPDSWNRIFRSNILLEMVLPLLDHRKKVGKLAQKAVGSGKNPGSGEKKALLYRLTSLIRQKLLKIRLSSMPLAGPIDMGAATIAFQHIMKEARKSKDKEQLSCCSSCLIFLLRIMPSSLDVISLATTEYGNVIREWSTQRTSGAFLLDDLISHMPTLAQASLLGALNIATQDARSPFLKVEAFRLLSLLLANTPNNGSTKIEIMTQAKIHDLQDDLLVAISKSLIDDEMVKPKRARSIFKAFEKYLPYISSPASPEAMSMLVNIKTKIIELGMKQSGLNIMSVKLVKKVDIRLGEFNAAAAAAAIAKDDTIKKTLTSSSKKSKKKKKKKR